MLKTYIWEDVLAPDYGGNYGLAVAVAESEEQALEMIKKQDERAWANITSGHGGSSPFVVSVPYATFIWGE